MVEQNEYTEQAERFLQENGIEFEVEFLRHGFHFTDDEERGKERNIYTCRFLRPNKSNPHGKWFSVEFGQSEIATESGEAPTSYDVLSCLTKSDPGQYRDFCEEFGYDTDSRKAYETWESVLFE